MLIYIIYLDLINCWINWKEAHIICGSSYYFFLLEPFLNLGILFFTFVYLWSSYFLQIGFSTNCFSQKVWVIVNEQCLLLLRQSCSFSCGSGFGRKSPMVLVTLGIFLIYKYFWNNFLYFGYINSTSFLRRWFVWKLPKYMKFYEINKK